MSRYFDIHDILGTETVRYRFTHVSNLRTNLQWTGTNVHCPTECVADAHCTRQNVTIKYVARQASRWQELVCLTLKKQQVLCGVVHVPVVPSIRVVQRAWSHERVQHCRCVIYCCRTWLLHQQTCCCQSHITCLCSCFLSPLGMVRPELASCSEASPTRHQAMRMCAFNFDSSGSDNLRQLLILSCCPFHHP
jgi:hypothetical protein